MSRIGIIGSGFSGLSAACILAKAGYDVTVLEKNEGPGGRARKFSAQGFVFDMGPSWYWMPGVFEAFFAQFGKKASDFYNLVRIDPSYRIFYPTDEVDVPADVDKLHGLFERLEPGSSKQLSKFLSEGKVKYELAMEDLIFNPGLSLGEFFSLRLVKGLFDLHVFESISHYVRRFFKDPRLIALLEFPVLFLGAKPDNIPALYSLMNYADMSLGTWYPLGGMNKIIEAITSIASSLDVHFSFNSPVERIEVSDNEATGLIVNGTLQPFDYIVASSDYHHTEQHLLPSEARSYSPLYWDKKVMAPSSLIFFLGINKRVSGLLHHNLFFDEDFAIHATEIYDQPQWPSAPQFYVCCPSQTDPLVAPDGCENIFILIPVAPDLEDTDATREKYFKMAIRRIEKRIGENIMENIAYKRSYAHRDFINDYNAFKGNAYGLANTLNQTANLKPSIVNKKVRNLFYTGQLTVPGPGVPPAIISGQVVANQLMKMHQEIRNPVTQ